MGEWGMGEFENYQIKNAAPFGAAFLLHNC
jgi:hypothetical protein